RLLEEDLGARLMTRTTRSVVLTEEGELLVKEAGSLLAQADAIAEKFRNRSRRRAAKVRLGAIDSAAAPRWTSRMATRGVRYIPLAASIANKLPLAAAWARGTGDPVRDEMLAMIRAGLANYAKEA